MNLLLLSLQHDHFQSGYCGGTPEETPVLHCPNTEATLYFVIWPVGECADMTAFHGRDMLSQIPGGAGLAAHCRMRLPTLTQASLTGRQQRLKDWGIPRQSRRDEDWLIRRWPSRSGNQAMCSNRNSPAGGQGHRLSTSRINQTSALHFKPINGIMQQIL